MDINNVIDAWNEQADGFNQWDDLGADEQVEFALKLCQSPQASREAGSDGVALLSGIDDIVSKIRSEEYRANSCYEKTGKKYFDGSGDSYKHCAEMLTEFIKKTT